jgi:translation initiation factor IF-2
MKENVVLPLQNVGTVWAFIIQRGAELMAGKYLMLNKEFKLIFPRLRKELTSKPNKRAQRRFSFLKMTFSPGGELLLFFYFYIDCPYA